MSTHDNNNDPPIAPEKAIAEVLELIRLMLEASPYPVAAEDFPIVAADEPKLLKRRSA